MNKGLRFMRRALSLAAKGGRAVHPNPMVGCVLVKNGRIVGEGFHARFGGPHAEVQALRNAGDRARGSTAFVTLEPCAAHRGKKTPPCTPALIKAGVRRVVAAVADPNPLVSNRGLAQLRRAGVKVSLGLCSSEAEALNAPFFFCMKNARPRVILKAALSLDGRAYTASGRSQWITGPQSLREGHRMRVGADAILVGVETVLSDNPTLTSHGHGRNPLRVVLDTFLRTPPRAKCLNAAAPTLIFTASTRRFRSAETVRVPSRRLGLDLKSVLKHLAQRGVQTLLIEGGPKVHASFLSQGLVDEACIFIAPKLISGASDPNKAPIVTPPLIRRVGRDLCISGKVVNP